MSDLANLLNQKSPLSDEQFKQLLDIAANHSKIMDWIDRADKANIIPKDQIAEQRQRAIDLNTQATNLIKVYRDLHPTVR